VEPIYGPRSWRESTTQVTTEGNTKAWNSESPQGDHPGISCKRITPGRGGVLLDSCKWRAAKKGALILGPLGVRVEPIYGPRSWRESTTQVTTEGNTKAWNSESPQGDHPGIDPTKGSHPVVEGSDWTLANGEPPRMGL
jgi:hypothetical protein